MHGWNERLAAGAAHEERVAQALIDRGWEVAPWGQGVLPPGIQEALSRSASKWRHFPDLVAAREGEIITVDAKDRMWSTQSGRYAVSRDCVSFGLQFIAAFGVPVFYVFGNLRVLSPVEVQAYGSLGPRIRGGAYFLVPERLGHHFDDVFGVVYHHNEAA
ncbi:hypothetical protein GCM10023085_45600 [Actinomadura viridis]|uniref:Holliday junction resolvase n=1 Tax=Actinomadura viridis TaxID=58110 RepID=A0A931DH12_9ACTN|nr:hypothetical protein [Actinomadura viridis]MBG6089920.1 Holliday junction resolvase [Actinomadura viridis]